MVRHEGEKMSKSLGNLVWARDLLGEYSADAVRLYLAGHHYAIEWSHDPGLLDRAGATAGRMHEAVHADHSAGPDAPVFSGDDWKERFDRAMQTDLDTPRAIGIIDDLAVRILLHAAAGEDVRPARDCLRELAGVIGLTFDHAPDAENTVAWSVHLKKFKTG
jgi:L-cysteine:1D-myo-inositol 2-amino-2-deoxy-alpha-D-glucopyranoside ligase